VGLGELLWDLLPTGACLGGAPANFAYITQLIGDEGIVASRVGRDRRGDEAMQRMAELGLSADHVQRDGGHSTGTAGVEIDARGQANFEIAENVAWDFLEWTRHWQHLATGTDAVCFGSLAQRSEGSRATIRRFLKATPPGTVKIFDVNLRQAYYSGDVLAESLKLADLVKVNDEELPKIVGLQQFPHNDEISSARRLLEAYELKMVCVTRGPRGSLLVERERACEHAGFRVKVADTVGSGDAFTAGLVHEYLRGQPLEVMSETANRVGAWVASQMGAMPRPGPGGLKETLKELRTW